MFAGFGITAGFAQTASTPAPSVPVAMPAQRSLPAAAPGAQAAVQHGNDAKAK
jgi:hypothetical protein